MNYEPDKSDDFMLRAARGLSGARRESMFADLVRSATDLLEADIGIIGRYHGDELASVETLACIVNGRSVANTSYALAGTPCETVAGQGFRFYPEGLAYLFPASPAGAQAIVAYAGYPLVNDDQSQLGVFAVMSKRPLREPLRAESLLRIYAERAVAEIRRIGAEEELQASEERYRSIFNASVDGLGLLSPEGRIIDVNAAMEALYGYDRSEMIGEKALSFARGPSRENAARFLQAVRSENYATMVDKACRRDGTEFYIEPRGVTVNYRGRPHILAIIRDVTERTLAERERAALETQLRQAQKMEALGHLTGGVAHDFNNILTSVLGYVELAHGHVAPLGDEKLNRYLARARRSGERARDLIQQMLTFSHGQQGAPRALEIGAHVRETSGLLESMIPATIRIDTAIDAALPPVIVDPVHIEQVLINLCLNARDAMPDGGALEIRVRARSCHAESCSACRAAASGRWIEIAVTDTGVGMPPELIERIFEPFFSTRETGKGSGMGLSTVHGIVHEYGGHIFVASTPGEGTTIAVLFPVAAAADLAVAKPGEPAADSSVAPRFRGTALLVDDNREVAEFVTDLLTDWGLDVNVFHDGEAALQHFLARPDACAFAIVDQTMPTVSGLELARVMLRERPELPVVLYTGYTDDVDDAMACDAGIRALLGKPLDTQQLHDVIAEIFQALPR